MYQPQCDSSKVSVGTQKGVSPLNQAKNLLYLALGASLNKKKALRLLGHRAFSFISMLQAVQDLVGPKALQPR